MFLEARPYRQRARKSVTNERKSIDRFATGGAVTGLRETLVEPIGANQDRMYFCIGEKHALLDERGTTRVGVVISFRPAKEQSR